MALQQKHSWSPKRRERGGERSCHVDMTCQAAAHSFKAYAYGLYTASRTLSHNCTLTKWRSVDTQISICCRQTEECTAQCAMTCLSCTQRTWSLCDCESPRPRALYRTRKVVFLQHLWAAHVVHFPSDSACDDTNT